MFGFKIDRQAEATITGQLTAQIRDAILCGKIEAGSKMPPTRSLARELGVSRNSVLLSYEQMIAEGYLTSAAGSGTFAADIGRLPAIKKPPAPAAAPDAQGGEAEDVIRFYAGTPDVSALPRAAWAKALRDACLDADDAAFGYGSPKGCPELTAALAGYLYRAKGIYCDPGRIVITPGTANSLTLIARLLYREGGCAAAEDPCISFVPGAIGKSGMRILPVEAGENGICTDALPEGPDVRLLYVSPSHQYPLGGVLPVKRRLDLLHYAQTHNAYVAEDDYDSEFRYQGEPIQSLWHLGGERTVYMGSFSNTFYPSLRIAYMVLPRSLSGAVDALTGETNISVGAVEQLALARLIGSKQMDRHVYRMKRLYDTKRRLLLRCLKDAFGTRLKISGEMAGLHLVAAFERDFTQEDQKAFADNGVEPDFAEDYAIVKGRHRGKLVLGYGNLSFQQTEEGVRRLKKALDG